MADKSKPLYVVLMNDEASSIDESVTQEASCSRYTRAALQSTLQLMGCKSRHAFKISNRVFDVLSGPPYKTITYHGKNGHRKLAELESYKDLSNKPLAHSCLDSGVKKPSKTNRKRSMVVIGREKFLTVVCDALAQYQYVGPNQRADLMLACRVRERKTSVTILLCGTSGCGKSTLSSLLASRLGITTVVSTDSIRHMMRSFVDEETSPLLWASTYHAGEYLDPVAVKEAAVRRKAMKSANSTVYNVSYEDLVGGVQSSTASTGYPEHQAVRELHAKSEHKEAADISSSTMVIEGFKAQCEMVIDSLDRLITSWEEKNESVVVEGVHLSLNFVMGLMRKHPSIIPFMIHITNEDKHLERFAVRAKYMTLDPSKNKYAKYIGNIRTIQQYLYKRADKHLVPKLNNTNVDKSVAAIHATIFSCLRRREAGEPLYDQPTNTVKVVDQEYRSQYAASSLGSKCMFQLIQRKGSSHHLMALMNTDGSVAKAWPIESIDTSGNFISGNGSETLGSPVYGPLQIAKAEPVNLQFGNFGLSAFPAEASSSIDTPGRDVTEAVNCINADSPRYGEGAEKELLDEATEFVHEEEAEDVTACLDSDEDLDENAQKLEDDELEGSVNESMRSDEEETEDSAIDHVEDNDTGHVESNSSDEHDEDYASGSTSLPRIEDVSFYMPNHIRNGFGSCGNDYCSSVNADKVVDFDKLKQPQTAESSVSLYGKEMQSLGKKTFPCF